MIARREAPRDGGAAARNAAHGDRSSQSLSALEPRARDGLRATATAASARGEAVSDPARHARASRGSRASGEFHFYFNFHAKH